MSPTRELAKQTIAVLSPFLESLPGAQATLLVGGRCACAPSLSSLVFPIGGRQQSRSMH